MDLVITILGWIALGVISAYLLAIIGKIIFDAATKEGSSFLAFFHDLDGMGATNTICSCINHRFKVG